MAMFWEFDARSLKVSGVGKWLGKKLWDPVYLKWNEECIWLDSADINPGDQ